MTGFKRAWPVLALSLAAIAAPRPVHAAAPVQRALVDSTTASEWTLPNGIRVVSRDIPRCPAIAVTVAYRAGIGRDPADTPGMVRVMGELQMTAAAGDVPERTREEIESQRPLGWSALVGPRFTELSELGTREQFPGMLRQVGLRMAGVSVTPEVLRRAVAEVRRELAAEYFGSPEQALYSRADAYAHGADENRLLDLASGKRLDRLTPKAAEAWLHRVFVPANAVVAISGDLSGLDLVAMLDHELGTIPAGAALAPSAPAFAPRSVALPRAGLDRAVGVVGLVAPAITDSLHPSFYLSMLLFGTHCKQIWSPDPPILSRFQYSLIDDPDLVRIYPTVPKDAVSADALDNQMRVAEDGLFGMTVPIEEYETLRYNVLWLLGGPMPEHVIEGVRREPATLNAFNNAAAGRAIWGDEAFWERYRNRLDPRKSPAFGHWATYVIDPEHQVRVLLTPIRK